MTRAASLLAVVLPVFCVSGCGTLCTLPELSGLRFSSIYPTECVYGGVLLDAESGVERLKTSVSKSADWRHLDNLVAGAYCLLVDLPLSAVADTLTLPITLRANQKRSKPAKELQEEQPEK